MDLAGGQGDHVVQTVQVQDTDNTGGADGGKDHQPGSKQNCLFVLRFYGPVNPMGSC